MVVSCVFSSKRLRWDREPPGSGTEREEVEASGIPIPPRERILGLTIDLNLVNEKMGP
jgi:hypothetical protein